MTRTPTTRIRVRPHLGTEISSTSEKNKIRIVKGARIHPGKKIHSIKSSTVKITSNHSPSAQPVRHAKWLRLKELTMRYNNTLPGRSSSLARKFRPLNKQEMQEMKKLQKFFSRG